MKYSKLFGIMAVAFLLAMPQSTQAQLLKGKLANFKEDIALNYAPDGNIMYSEYHNLKVDADGSFTFDMEMTQPTADVIIYVGEKGTLGAQLVKGKTVEMTITKVDGDLQVAFKAPNIDVCRFLNQKAKSFDMGNYDSMDPSERKPNAEYRALLEKENSKVKALLPKIKDKKLRSYYSDLAAAEYKWLKVRLIADDCEHKKIDRRTNTDLQELLNDLDVNDAINYQTNLSLWALLNKTKSEMKGNNEAYCYELIDLTKQMVTNPNLRRQMVQIIGQNYYTYGDGTGNVEEFTKRFREFAGEHANIADGMYKQFMEVKKAKEKTASGVPAPDITLDLPDGKQVQLKDICKGKFTYIDVWATWCGPCKMEIPFMEKLVERFKGNDKVMFISISVDENVEAWKKMIEKDKPQWAQYNIHGKTNQQFSADWGITGIPRFIMIDKDGNIFAADATRPSNEETAKTIEEQTK